MSFWHLSRLKRVITVVLVASFVVIAIFNLTEKKSSEACKDDEYDPIKSDKTRTRTRLAVIVPFRDRFDELIVFVPYLSQFLRQQDVTDFKILIINQSNRYRFNRGALINVGYTLVKNQSDYIAMHDVDLVPVNKNLSYSYPQKGPYHLSSSDYHPQYNYEKYFGGILLITNEQFEMVNGMSNRYFGWGLEDDEFYTRIKAAGLPIFKPRDLSTNRTNTFLHFHHGRKRDTYKSKEQIESSRRRDRVTGLKDLKFSVTSSHHLTIDKEYDCHVYNVELFCDTKSTPWCLKKKAS